MKKITILSLSLTLAAAAQAQTAEFDYFKYAGNDARFNVEIDKTHQYYNPVLAGFYPDPSLCRVGDTYYLVNSSFTFFPGVPLSTSKDLVNWQPAGHVLDRTSQVPLKGQHVSGGIFAPAISYNKKNKTFYMITTNVGAGNFFVKSKDPSKGWSEPIYLRKIDGIDPSFFFDDNGKGYIVHNGPVVGGADYEGQRSIRCFEFDVKGDSIKGDFKEILRGGTHVEARPIWIEGPHLFKKGKFYYLMCAEGGTGGWHSEVILRAKNPMGPWVECPNNPILTQRTGLDPNRKDPVSSAGHADIVEDGKGNWWAVFLACRPYEEDMYNTGRDTYLLPVTWKNGWPEILAKNTPISRVGEKAGLKPAEKNEFSGNFSYVDNFEVDNNKAGLKELNPRWMFLRDFTDCYKVENGKLKMNLLPGNIYKRVLDIMMGNYDRGYEVGMGGLTDGIFHPTSEGGLIILTGRPNSGKTDFLNCLMAHLMYHNQKRVAFFSFEKPIKGKHVREIARIALGVRNTEDMDGAESPEEARQENRKVLDYLSEHMVDFDTKTRLPDSNYIIGMMEAMMNRKKQKIDYLVIDPYVFINMTEGGSRATETEKVRLMLTKLQAWSRTRHIWTVVVAHPRIQYKDGHEAFPPLDIYSVAGSAQWANLADFLLTVNRISKPEEGKMFTIVEMLKVRGLIVQIKLVMQYRPYMTCLPMPSIQFHGSQSHPLST